MVHFDTLRYAKTLEISGFSSQQAEALARANQEALSESLDTTFATKKDIDDLKEEIQEVKVDVLKLESKVSVHSWMLSATLTGVGALVFKAFFN